MTDSNYTTCNLCQETLEKARRELGENPETRHLEIQNIRRRLEMVPGLKARTDTRFLLKFLRHRKFDQERAFQSILKLYQVRKDFSHLMRDLKPSAVSHLVDTKTFELLRHRDKEGRRVLIWRADNWSLALDRYEAQDYLKLLFVFLTILSNEEETQVNGLHVILHLKGLSLKHLTIVTPSYLKAFFSVTQGSVPLRFQRVDYVYEPAIFNSFFSLFKPFMSEKQLQRRFFNGQKLDALHATIDPEFLPTDLGGKLEPFGDMEWFDEFFCADREFEEDNKYGYLSMRLEDGKKDRKEEDADLQGMGGTFKKLEL